jgi:hypothetical protein
MKNSRKHNNEKAKENQKKKRNTKQMKNNEPAGGWGLFIGGGAGGVEGIGGRFPTGAGGVGF